MSAPRAPGEAGADPPPMVVGVVGAMGRNGARALVGFGAAGLVLAAVLVLGLLLVAGPMLASAATLDHERAAAATALRSASSTLAATATSVEGATTSLASAESTLRDAAAAMVQLADAASSLGPFGGGLAETATRTRALSDELSRTADAVTRNEADAQTVTADIRALGTQVDELARSLDDQAAGFGWIAGPGGLVLLVTTVALVGWLGLAAAACLWVGRQALRRGTPASSSGRPVAGRA